jgi:glycosyltransferase involved in cell wall biosynthesis
MLLSRLVPIKGIDVALRAAALGGDITLIVAGEGPMRAPWTRDAERLNVPVRWLGNVQGEEKYRWLQACDAFALPSRTLPSGRSEGLPCALLEALACAVPAVASELPGIRELAENYAPELRLVRPDDPAALHRAWVALRDTPAPASSRLRTANTIRERFGWHRVGAEVDSLLGRRDA